MLSPSFCRAMNTTPTKRVCRALRFGPNSRSFSSLCLASRQRTHLSSSLSPWRDSGTILASSFRKWGAATCNLRNKHSLVRRVVWGSPQANDEVTPQDIDDDGKEEDDDDGDHRASPLLFDETGFDEMDDEYVDFEFNYSSDEIAANEEDREDEGDWYDEDDDDDSVADEEEEEEESSTPRESELAQVDVESKVTIQRSDSSPKYNAVAAAVEASWKGISKKLSALQMEYDKAQQFEETLARANLIVSNLYQLPAGTERANVQDWESHDGADVELILDTAKYATFQEESDALFAAARKMKRGTVVVQELMDQVKQVQQKLQAAAKDLEASCIVMESNEGTKVRVDEEVVSLVQSRLKKESTKEPGFKFVVKEALEGEPQSKGTSSARPNSQSTKRKPRAGSKRTEQTTLRRFTSPAGLSILVGRNRRDNEAICFQVARDSDIWFHSRGVPGAHVLLQIRRGSPQPTDDCYQFAANLAAFYSEARVERKAPITMAETKHIVKPRGAPLGAVALRKELGTILGHPQDVPEEAKTARKESGFAWDEMGTRSLGGKSRNRKRTQAVTKQEQSKRRAERREKNKRRQRKQASSEEDNFY